MKKVLLLIVLISRISFAQVQEATFSISPATFNEDEEITITVSDINPGIWGVSEVYLWAWSYDVNGENALNSPTNGEWEASNEVQKLTNNGR